MALVPSRANVLADGVSSWKIIDTTDADAAYHLLPFLRTGKVNIDSLSTKDGQGRPVVFAYEIKGSAQFPAVKTEANFVKLFDTLASKLIDHKITLNNGQVISSNPGTSTMSPTGFGLKLKLISEADMDKDMYCEMSIHRRLTVAEYTKITTSANAPADGTDPGTDVLHNLDSLTRTDIVPAGISTFACDATGGSYADVVSNLRNAKFSMELLCTKDSRSDFAVGFAWKTMLSLEGLETKEAELQKWPGIATRANESKITFINGMIATFPTQLGISNAYAAEKDTEDVAVMKINGEGIILNASMDGIWS